MTDAFFSRTVSAAADTANVNAHSGGRKLFEEAKVPDKLHMNFWVCWNISGHDAQSEENSLSTYLRLRMVELGTFGKWVFQRVTAASFNDEKFAMNAAPPERVDGLE